jgi:hypothetical protein
MGEAIYEGNDATGVGENGVPFFEHFIGRDYVESSCQALRFMGCMDRCTTAVELDRCLPRVGWLLCKPCGQAIDCRQIAIGDRPFLISNWDLLEKAQDVLLGIHYLYEGRLPRMVKVASSAGHPMSALVEKLVSEKPVAEIVVGPQLAVGYGLLHGVLVDEGLDGPNLRSE